MDIKTIWEIMRKEFYEHIKTRRFIIISSIYAFLFLLMVWLLSNYSGMLALDFKTVITNAHSSASIFYIILPIALSFDLISGEYTRKSIFLLLSKSVEREEIIIGKFLGTLATVCTVIIPVATLGNIMAGTCRGFPSIEVIGKIYIYLVIVIFACSCYISLSMLFSTLSRTSGISLILSLVVGWFALDMLYPISLMYTFFTGIPTDIPMYSKIFFAMSPSNNLSVVLKIISEKAGGDTPIGVPESILALTVFFVITFIITTSTFRRKELT